MLTSDMDISRSRIDAQQVEEEKLREREYLRNTKVETGNESRQQNGSVNRSSFKKTKRDLHHHLLVHLHLEIKVSIMARI